MTDYVGGQKFSGYMGFNGIKLKDKNENFMDKNIYIKSEASIVSLNDILSKFEKIVEKSIRTPKCQVSKR